MLENLKKYIKGDNKIWWIIIFLSIASVLVVYSATGELAFKQRGGNTSYYMFKQLVSIMMGIGIIIVMSNIPYRYYSRFSFLFLCLSIGLLVYALLFGTNINEATRWVRLPVIGLQFQPSELAKIAIVIYVARILAQNQNDKEALKKSFWGIIIATGIVFMLIFTDNLSTAILLFSVVMIMMIIGRMPFKYIFGTGAIAIGVLAFVLLLGPKVGIKRAETWVSRIEVFLSPGKGVDTEKNYQSNQAKIAVATGGFLGKGPGNSQQRNFLPHPYSDFIYAIIAEEYGLTGATLTLGAYIFLLWCIGAIVRKSSRTFPALMVAGLGFLLVSQAIINMGVSVGIFPVTGQPLPLVSMGTSSIVSTCIAFGAILSVSANNKEEAAKAKIAENNEEIN